jgi:hypothetical protein
MKGNYWKFAALLCLGALSLACRHEPGDDPDPEPGPEPGPQPEQPIVRSYKLGTLAGFEKHVRQNMDVEFTNSSTMYNRSLFCRYVASAYPGQTQDGKPYPAPITEQDWWDNFVEEVAYSGQDYVAMNCRGQASPDHQIDHGRPDKLPDLMAAIRRKGVENRFKIAIFDDTPASWAAARNLHKGYGYSGQPTDKGKRVPGSHYPLLFIDPEKDDRENGADGEFRKDIYYYIWEANLKPAFENVPREYWFEIDGRPVILFWNPNGFLQDSYLDELMRREPQKYVSTTGLDRTKSNAYNGKLSYILKCIHEDFEKTFGVEPFLIVQREWTDRDFSLVNSPYLNGIHNWFAVPTRDMTDALYQENLTYNTYIASYNFKGFRVGSGCPGFVQGDRDRPNWQYIDSDHGRYAEKMFGDFLTHKPDLVFLEGFTDLVENAAWWRSSDKTYYDYPNQRINQLRKYGNDPFPKEQRLEAEACDYSYMGAVSGNRVEMPATAEGLTNAPENGIVKRCEDAKYNGGWHVELTAGSQNALRWKELPFKTGKSTIRFRYASDEEASVYCRIGDTVTQSVTLASTAGEWREAEVAVYTRQGRGYADLDLAVTRGGIKLNYAEIVAEN